MFLILRSKGIHPVDIDTQLVLCLDSLKDTDQIS